LRPVVSLIVMFEVQQLLAGQRRALARAITLVESSTERHREEAQRLLEAVLPHTGKSIRIGITGTPGVGKSTFIEVFGKMLIDAGHHLAVLAVDPSSPVAGGSLLGDKTRMEQLSREPNAFIRPSPSRGHLGGVAQSTRESILLCEAAGFDVILVETVGVGQSEVDVANMVDFFMVLLQPNAGDELQGIKKGLIELADALIINKADGEGRNLALQAARHYQNAINLISSCPSRTPIVQTCSARENEHVDTIWEIIQSFWKQSVASGLFLSKRSSQNQLWMERVFAQMLTSALKADESFKALSDEMARQVAEGQLTALGAARKMTEVFLGPPLKELKPP
jgi:LAO/AO transport system kinase